VNTFFKKDTLVKKSFRNILVVIIAFSILLYLFFNRHAYNFSGYAIGTTYHIVVYNKYISSLELQEIKIAIEDELSIMNMIFSTFEDDSELSKLNAISENVYFKGSDALIKVMSLAKGLYQLTEGYYDPTVDPIVRLWGFGRDSNPAFPSKEEIEASVALVGYDSVLITGNRIIKNKNLTIDLASIAKGYAVDAVVRVLEKYNQKNYMVEVGGELYVKGNEFYKKGWDVVIVDPENVQKGLITLRLKNKGVATSGNYRNFRLYEDGKRYHHIIDPKTGYPVFNDLVSVTIIADTTVIADGLATGVFVMGAEKGLKLINSLKNVEAVLIQKTQVGLKVSKSDGI
jgi:thiamine biosynthesis lipoprotein